MNGSTDLLARAMRQVFEETMTSVRNGMNADMKEEIHTLEKKIEKKIDTTNQNM